MPDLLDNVELQPQKLKPIQPGDEIVISGIAGRFPESNNLDELRDNLMNKVDLITDDGRRWKLDHPEIPQRTGKINNIEKFDALFFGVNVKQANTMDPISRMLLEHAYEAIIDAGYNPSELRGSRIGVFSGACFSETEKTFFYDKTRINGLGLTGCCRAMYSNRISYWLNVNGPSYTVDSACSSSLYAFEHAYKAIRDGVCDAAIVGGANLCLHPFVSMQFFKLGVLSTDGRCKTFDEAADGYVRGEAVSVVFLQKAKDAKRIYAQVVHSKSNCDGFKEQGITFPASPKQGKLLKEFYMECGIPPSDVNYIEAHGTGTKVGDPEEVNAIDSVLAVNRSKDSPLLIGSVKSNLGHSEACSGLASVTKVVLAMEAETIPPNLHYKNCKKEIKGILEGRIKVVTDPYPWKGGYAAISSFGFGGANAHVLLKSYSKRKLNKGKPNDDLPRLVVTSGRTEEAVFYLLNNLERKPVDVEQVRLLHDIHSDNVTGHLYRGYTILPAQGVNETPLREITSVSDSERPVWFIFTGMGSQWPGMGEALLRIPIFADAISKCDAVLKPLGIDIYKIITDEDETTFDNIVHSFVGIAAVQIGLVDILNALGIKPDYIIGHSVGELGCAYADGCFTAEQMILSSYSRGLASIEANVIHGSMAAIGIGFEELKDLCPKDIDIACHNSRESATISGPTESVKKFVAELKAKGIFAKEVNCSNIPYHSRYIKTPGSKLLSYLQKVVPNSKRRSNKWISTSVAKDKWDTKDAQFSSPEYHTNNFLNPVLFEEISTLIPENAIAIEIAPHGLLQAILKRSLHPSVINIPLTRRGHKNSVELLLQAIGKMFNAGLHPQLANIYPYIQYPVSSSTPMISPLIKWEHTEDFFVASYSTEQDFASSERIVKISLADEAYASMAGHIIDGRNLLPATGYLTLVWESISMMQGKSHEVLPVVFEDIKFLRATNIPANGEVELTIVVQKGTGRFEVVEGGAAVVTGTVRLSSNPAADRINIKIPKKNTTETMTSRDVYKELRLRGYQYSGIYRGIKKAVHTGEYGHIVWNNDWVAFMDSLMQIKVLSLDSRGLFVPTAIKKFVIDPITHLSQMQSRKAHEEIEVYYNKLHDVIYSCGIEIKGLKASAIGRRKPTGDPVLEEYRFVPFTDGAEVTLREMSRLTTHIGMENHVGIKVKTVELIDETEQCSVDDLLSPWISEALGDVPSIQADVVILSSRNEFEDDMLPANVTVIDPKKVSKDGSAMLAVGQRLLMPNRANNLKVLLEELKPGGFLLSREVDGDVESFERAAERINCHFVMFKKFGSEKLILLKKQSETQRKMVVIKVNNDNFNWVNEMHERMTAAIDDNATVIFVGQGDFENGLMGFINCMKQEVGGDTVRGILVQDPKAPEFSLQNPLYMKQIQKDLLVSVLRENSVWGSYRHLPLPPLENKPVYHALINQKVRGDLSSLTWIEGPIRPTDDPKDIVEIHYSSINFRDIMLATGKLSIETVAKTRLEQECVIGIEYSGVDAAGKRVMGILINRGLANRCVADPYLVWEIPNDWTLEDAITVPCVYVTCLYAFFMKGQMKRGHSILIHAGTGGIGQAAINIALHTGCEVFTTVGTPEKRRFIRKHFPQIEDDHIGNSRDTSFEQMIMEKTNGRGVDIVLNSLSEEKLQASVNCLAEGGKFLEIGKFDLSSNNPLGMECFLREISFQGVLLERFAVGEIESKLILAKLLKDGLESGAIKPLIRTVFKKDQVEEAFRYMAAGKHVGKVVIKVRDEKLATDNLLAEPRFHCLKDRSYIVLGGLGGFGLELVDWMILRGARNLVITSRTGVKNGYQNMRIELWKSYGAKIIIVSGKDPSSRKDCQNIIETAAKLAPVAGVFNLAVVLKDALWDNQTPETFEESFRCKAWATKNFDLLTRKLCPELRHFVVFSSVSCGRGNAGQTNYGMSNSVMERICERRVAEGLPGLAVQWGAIGDVGLVADMQEENKELIIGGTLQQKISSCLQELDQFLQQSRPVVSSMVVAEKKAGGSGSLNILETVLNIMGLRDLKGVSATSSLAELGMDSMMSVEIKQTLEREFEVYLSAQDIRALNFSKLQEMVDAGKLTNEKTIKPEVDRTEMPPGTELLVRLIGTTDLNNETCLRLKTKEESGRNKVILIPGIEGTASIFTELASKLKFRAKCLQLGLINANFDSVPEMADYFLPYLLKETEDCCTITLVGYSFGALIAIELVRRLEVHNRNCRFILVDGAPEQLSGILLQKNSRISEEELQSLIFIIIMNVLVPNDITMFTTALKKCKTWEEKLAIFIQMCPETKLKMSVEEIKEFCLSVYKRVLATLSYSSLKLPPIKTPITLIKPTIQSVQLGVEDYGLSKITIGKVDVHVASGNHVTILDDEKVANAINGEPIQDE